MRDRRALQELGEPAEEDDLVRRAPPRPGPMSSTRSAARITSGSCSTTTIVLPASRRRLQHADEPADVPRVQADARLVQDEQRVHQGGAQGGGEVDPLHLAAAQGAGLPVQGEVAQAHVHQVAQARPDLGQGAARWPRPGARGASMPLEERQAPVDGQEHHVVDGELLLPDLPEQGLGLQPRAAAGGARRVGPVLGQQHPDVHPVALGFQPLEEALRAEPDPVVPFALAVDHPGALLRGELAPGHVRGHAAPAGELHELVLHLAEALRLPRPHGAARQALACRRGRRGPSRCRWSGRSPRQVAQAPTGELKENRFGVGSS